LLKYFTSDADAKSAKILLCKADLYINVNINIKQITERIIPTPYIQNTFDIDTQLE